MPDIWNAAFESLHPGFRQLHDVRCWQAAIDWPACTTLTDILPEGLCAQSGEPIHFLPQDHTLPYPELYYEERIFQHGIVSTRPNWHDFFNALMWRLFPQTKVQINALHAADMQQQGKKRTPQRDALTILDESGVIIAATRRELLQYMLDFAWEPLFWQERAAWGQEIGCYMIGHAMLEKLLTPYVGMTAHALLVEVDAVFFSQPLAAQQAYLDGMIAEMLREGGLYAPVCLNPFPLLGVPGWWENDDKAFYGNSGYFRSKTRSREVIIIRNRKNHLPN